MQSYANNFCPTNRTFSLLFINFPFYFLLMKTHLLLIDCLIFTILVSRTSKVSLQRNRYFCMCKMLLCINSQKVRLLENIDIQQQNRNNKKQKSAKKYLLNCQYQFCFIFDGIIRYQLDNKHYQFILRSLAKMGNDMICGCIQRDNQAEKSFDAQHLPPAIYSDRILHLDGQNFANHPHKALYNKLANRRTLKNTEAYKPTKIIELTLNNQKGLYVGQYANGKPQGEGKLYMQNGDYYDGHFVNGQFTGHQAMIIVGYGSYYYGDVQKFLPNGNGEKMIQGLCFQVGKFIDGKLNGKGQKHDLLDKSQYKGFFKDGKKNGKGLLKKNQNEYYEGYFKEDIRQGLGHQKTLDYHYWGPFLNNEKSGKGTLKFNDGKKFEGYFIAGKPNGYGELHYPNGDVKKGQFYSMHQLQN